MSKSATPQKQQPNPDILIAHQREQSALKIRNLHNYIRGFCAAGDKLEFPTDGLDDALDSAYITLRE